MSLKHALLGFLNYSPMTGYELKKFFDASVAHFWSAELSQIYPTLKQLEAEGFVDMNVEQQDGKPNRKIYALTDDGREELLSWLAHPAEPDTVREPILIKIFFAADISKEAVIAVLEKRIADLQKAIPELRGSLTFSKYAADAMQMPGDGFFWSLTPELGIKICQAEIEWAQESIEKIRAVELPKRQHPGPHMDARGAVEMLDRVKHALPAGTC